MARSRIDPRYIVSRLGLLLIVVFCLVYGLIAEESSNKVEANKENTETKKVMKTEEEWKAQLTTEEFRILRKAGTERPNGKIYEEFKEHGAGVYFCIGCDTELFTSETKFDSRCGWPSFYDPADAENVNTFDDFHLGYRRTEVRCAVCDGHLGHVFKGEGFDTPTDKRYCINGAILKFVPFDSKPRNTGKKEEAK